MLSKRLSKAKYSVNYKVNFILVSGKINKPGRGHLVYN